MSGCGHLGLLWVARVIRVAVWPGMRVHTIYSTKGFCSRSSRDIHGLGVSLKWHLSWDSPLRRWVCEVDIWDALHLRACPNIWTNVLRDVILYLENKVISPIERFKMIVQHSSTKCQCDYGYDNMVLVRGTRWTILLVHEIRYLSGIHENVTKAWNVAFIRNPTDQRSDWVECAYTVTSSTCSTESTISLTSSFVTPGMILSASVKALCRADSAIRASWVDTRGKSYRMGMF